MTSVASGVHLTPCRLQHSSTLSCRPVSTTATRFSPGSRRLLQTDCNECWMLRHVLSATPGSLIVACHGLCILSFIGWTFLNESTTNSVCSCTDASTTKLLGTWWTTAHQYPTLSTVNGFVLPAVIKSLFHGTGSVPMDVGHLPLLAWLSGTLCPRTCVIRMFLRTVTGSHWRRFYFRSTSVFSALEVFYENALYKFTFDIDIDIGHCDMWLLR